MILLFASLIHTHYPVLHPFLNLFVLIAFYFSCTFDGEILVDYFVLNQVFWRCDETLIVWNCVLNEF